MHLFDLNDDVLNSILSRVDSESLVDLMATCHIAYELAIQHLLYSVDLRLHVKQVLDFCKSILSSQHTSMQLPSLLKSLSMSDGAKILRTDPPFMSTLGFSAVLTMVLEQSHNLRKLHIEEIELLIEYHSQICDAIVGLPALTSITFTGAGPQSFAMISRMRGLRHVHVEHVSDLIPVIRPFHTTLETISSEYKHWRNFEDLQALADTDQWPRVHTLKLGVINVPHTRLVRAFPNLRNLRLQGSLPLVKETLLAGLTPCWPSLDYVEGLIVELYRLALTCPIRELRFNSPPENLLSTKEPDGTEKLFRPPSMFLDIIQSASPVALSFPVSATMQDELFFRQLAALLPRLKILGILVDLQPTSTISHLNLIAKCLENVPIVYFTLELSRSTPHRVDPEELQMYLRPALLIPTVRYIELQVRGNPKHPAFGTKMRAQITWWKVPSDRVNGAIERISGDLGRQFREICLKEQVS